MLLLIAFGYVNSGDLQIKQFIAANVLFVLSLFGVASIKRIAIISIVLAIIIPLGVAQLYLEGKTTVELVIIYVAIFAYLIMVAVRAIWPGKGNVKN